MSLIQINRVFESEAAGQGIYQALRAMQVMGHSSPINVLSVYVRDQTGFCAQDGCSLHNPRSMQGRVLGLAASGLHYY